MKEIGDTIKDLQNTPSEEGRTSTGKEVLYIVKIGGNIIDDEEKLSNFLTQFANVPSPLQGTGAKKILIHGGGKLATKMAGELNIPQQMVDGRRITDAATLRIVTMVYAGYINKNVVAQLQANNCNAIGLSGADGNVILAHKRTSSTPSGEGGTGAGGSIDYGFAGDVDAINAPLLKSLLEQQMAVVMAPITHDQKGQLLNTNADTIAQEVATGMSSLYDVQLIYSFEKSGVLLDANDDSTVIQTINPTYYQQLKTEQKIFAGMIPKLDNAFAALNRGVKKVIIGKAEQLLDLIAGKAGTSIVHE